MSTATCCTYSPSSSSSSNSNSNSNARLEFGRPMWWCPHQRLLFVCGRPLWPHATPFGAAKAASRKQTSIISQAKQTISPDGSLSPISNRLQRQAHTHTQPDRQAAEEAPPRRLTSFKRLERRVNMRASDLLLSLVHLHASFVRLAGWLAGWCQLDGCSLAGLSSSSSSSSSKFHLVFVGRYVGLDWIGQQLAACSTSYQLCLAKLTPRVVPMAPPSASRR